MPFRDQFLLLSSQLVVAVPCGVDGRAAVDRDRADLGNEVVYRFGFGLVVRLFQLFVLMLCFENTRFKTSHTVSVVSASILGSLAHRLNPPIASP